MMKKHKIMSILLSVIMVFSLAATASAAPKAITVKVDGKTVKFPDAKPYYEGSRVMIPVRFVSESLGARVTYKKATSGSKIKRTVGITLNGKNIEMDVNSDAVLVDQKIIKLDVPARLQNERVFVPIRFVSEALGADVKWSQANRLVTITTTKKPTTPTDPTTTPGAGNDDDNMYGDFQFKSGFTDLAKALFTNNAKVSNGTLTFTVPKDAKATYWSKDMASKKLESGKTHTYTLGANKGSVTITLIYPGKNEQESYTLFLDSKETSDLASKFGSITNDAIVALATKNGVGANTLSKVIAAAKAL
ncbi:copper amine oxidase N-terminal domain-containing protein [Paenibacillus amylolyticus]|uniref:Copper amine oxidase N-terminal domain-containing protein n=1 Tax=Paenibacillus amylolyticus TaxID=1451 RepID=A0ABD8B303_PAEAM